MKKQFYFASVLTLLLAFFTVGCATPNSLKEISPQEAYLFQKDKKAVIIDVREKNETDKGRVKDSVLLPMSLMKNDPAAFNSKVAELKKFNSVIVYCHSGRRAGIVGTELKKSGLDVYNLGGFDSWKNQQLPIE